MSKRKRVQSRQSTQPRQTTWQAPDFLHFEKGTWWYTVFTIVLLIVLILAIYYKNWLLAGVMTAAMFALFTYAKDQPAQRKFIIDGSGVQVGNRKYKYDELKSFWLVATPSGKLLYLRSVKRFSPPVMVNIGENDPIKIHRILINHLPEERRSEELIDRINRWIRF